MDIDTILPLARKHSEGLPNERVRVKRRSLALMVQEIDKLRSQLTEALDRPHAYLRNGARSTERRAAVAALGRSGSQRHQVAEFIASRGTYGAIDDEVARALGLMPPRVATRRGELTDGGWVEVNGQERKTRSGQDAAVWVATDKTHQALKTTGTP